MDIRTTTIARLLAATFFAALATHFYLLLRPYPLIRIPTTLALAGAAINVGLRGCSGLVNGIVIGAVLVPFFIAISAVFR